MTGLRSPATDAAAALLAALVASGARDVVVSPGSRSQALALVAAALEEHGRVRLHVRIDERVAGFTALGLARETRVPAVLVCTSGTAAANYLPAILEAHHAGVPLLVLTADRPPELRGVGANQTTDQPVLYPEGALRLRAELPTPTEADATGEAPATCAVRDMARTAYAAAAGSPERAAGPVHLDLPYREPLAGRLPDWLAAATPSAGVRSTAPAAGAQSPAGSAGPPSRSDGAVGSTELGGRGGDPAFLGDHPAVASPLPRGPRTIVLAGADAGARAEEIAHEGGWPLVAEIVSGARYGRHVVHGYRALLGDPALGGRVERVVVVGHPTLARETTALLSRPDVEIVALRRGGEALDLNGASRAVADVAVERGPADREWLGAWLRASRDAAVDLSPPAPDADGLASAEPRARLDAIAAELGVLRAPVDRVALVDAVWRATWPHDRLVFGSSRLVRVADDVLGGKKVPVHANRGLAGIDGTVATALGIALASQAGGGPGVTRVLLGDLAFLHDVGALLLPPGESRPRIQVVVGNDGGGTIFDGLEVAATADPAAMDRVLYTPQNADLAAIARAYGWEHVRVGTRGALDQALTSPALVPQLVEVPLPR